MNAAFYASLPLYSIPATSAGYAIWYGSQPNHLRCRWVIDPTSRKPVAVWAAEDEYLISFK
jgi:hypothetical protein